MKKRLTSILLTICMVACLFSGMTVTAHADGVETVEYTLQKGDNVYSVCQKLGIDFHANYDWITKTNNITNYSGLAVGKKLILPLGSTAGAVGGNTGNTGSNTTVSGTTSVKLLEGDKVISYLVPHVVSSGDTLYDICLAKGINYKDNIDTIMKINNLKNANRIAVGRTLLLPSATAPASGSCLAVVSHKVVSGDATYNLCKSYGIEYKDNLELLKVINNKKDMASIKTGQNLLIPVPATVVANNNGGNAGNPGNAGNTGNTGNNNNNNNNANNNNNNNNADSSAAYKITKNSVNVNQGSYSVLVNAESASTAKAGDTVTVNVSAKKGYRLDYVKVVDANGNNVTVNSTSFKMPASDVTVSVIFVADADYRITRAYSSNGSFTTTVNGSEAYEAAEGQTVKINPDPAYGYEVESITVTRSTNSATTVAVSNKSFVMPKYDVTVKVTFKSAANHDIQLGTFAYGTFDTSINGTTVTKAKAGDVVTVNTKPLDGYAASKITVKGTNNGETVEVTGNTFIMPEYKVTVDVKFSADEFNVISNSTSNGSFTVNKTSAKVGDWMQVVATPDTGYVVDKMYFTDANGDKVEITSADGSFTMPARDTTISVSFRMRPYYLSTEDKNTKFVINGKEDTRANMGETVTVKVTPPAGYKVKSIEAKRTSGGKVVEVKDNSFVMPAGNVTVTVNYELETYKLTGKGLNGYVFFEVGGVRTTTAKMGQTVKVIIEPDPSHTPSSITVTCGGKPVGVNGGTGEFAMPAGDVLVDVVCVD